MSTADHVLPEVQLVDRDGPISLFSVVVPIHNEARNLNELLARIYRATEGLAERREVIVVNDGSTDDGVALLFRLRNDYPDLKLVSLSRNFGKEVAMTAGLDFAEGDVVAILDADLQHPPEVLREFVGKWREGFDMVYGVPSSREHEGRLLRSIKKIFYHYFNLVSQHYMPIDAGDFRLIDRRLVDELKRFPERTRFMKGLFAWVGFSHTGVQFDVDVRREGPSSWNFWRLWNFALTGLTSFSTLPLRIWSYTGAIVALLAILYATAIIIRTVLYGIDVPGYATIVVLILFLGGIQLLSIGILGEYISRIFEETKQRPLYLVDYKSTFGFKGLT